MPDGLNGGRWQGHEREHAQRKAALDERWLAHERAHEALEKQGARELEVAVDTQHADDAAHGMVHEAHAREHGLNRQVVSDASSAHAREHVLSETDIADKMTIRWENHGKEHEAIAAAIDHALTAVDRERTLHATAHEAAHAAHTREHEAEAAAIVYREKTGSGDRELRLASHAKEHELEAVARDKAEVAMSQRLAAMNEVRDQLKEQALTFARADALAVLTDRVIAIEKLDVKGEAKGQGYASFAGWIIVGFGLIATVLGIFVVAVNFFTP